MKVVEKTDASFAAGAVSPIARPSAAVGPGVEPLGPQRCAGQVQIGGRRTEPPSELPDREVVVIVRAARRDDPLGVGRERRGIPRRQRDRGLDRRRRRQRARGLGARRHRRCGTDPPAARIRRGRRGRGLRGDRRDRGHRRGQRERRGEAAEGAHRYIQGGSDSGDRATPSRNAAACHASRRGAGGAATGAVSRMNCVRAATTAAASSGEASGATIDSWGRRFIALPNVSSRARAGYTLSWTTTPSCSRSRRRWRSSACARPSAITTAANGRCPPRSTCRARRSAISGRCRRSRGELALLKWITSFPGNPARGLPTVNGIVCLSDATTGLPLMLLDARSVTALRTGAVAAVASQALAPAGARSVGVIGCGLHGAWVARCMTAAGYREGVCHDPVADNAERLAAELGWRAGDREAAVACDVVCCVTPGAEIVIGPSDLRPGLHLNMLGADGPGKAEADPAAVAACALYCDEWEQASHGGELTGAINAGLVDRAQVSELGAVLAGDRPGRPDEAAVTLFDSTGLAIQDLAVAGRRVRGVARRSRRGPDRQFLDADVEGGADAGGVDHGDREPDRAAVDRRRQAAEPQLTGPRQRHGQRAATDAGGGRAAPARTMRAATARTVCRADPANFSA